MVPVTGVFLSTCGVFLGSVTGGWVPVVGLLTTGGGFFIGSKIVL